MELENTKILNEDARAIATYGFEQGFKEAIDFIRVVAGEGNGEHARKLAELLIETLQVALPSFMESVPEMFTIQATDDGLRINKIRFQYKA